VQNVQIQLPDYMLAVFLQGSRGRPFFGLNRRGRMVNQWYVLTFCVD
jgi:hypothetical protein